MRLPRILIVEDDWMIALDLERTIEEAIYAEVVTAASVAQALRLVDGIHFALLDVDVTDGTTYRLAERLCEDGIPFAFVTGSSRRVLPDGLRDRPFISKPYVPNTVIALLRERLEVDPASHLGGGRGRDGEGAGPAH